MGYNHLSANNLSFQYEQSTHTVFSNISFTVNPGWTAVVGKNGCGKSTLFKLIAGELQPDTGTISTPDHIYYCPQGAEIPQGRLEEFYEAFYAGESAAGELFGLLKLDYDWPYRLLQLSYGENRRLQLACALYQEPEVLILDEPTNHLDEEGMELLLGALIRYSGIGLVVSHDRDFLNRLCSSTLFFEQDALRHRPGTVTEGLEQQELERQTAVNTYSALEKQASRLRATARNKQKTVEQKKGSTSKRSLRWKDSDSRYKIDQARMKGRDVIGSKLYKSADNQATRAEEKLAGLQKPSARKTGITIHGKPVRSDCIAQLPPGQFHFCDGRIMEYPELQLKPADRIALTGANGSGKTTLIRKLCQCLHINSDQVLYLPQEFSIRELQELEERFSAYTREEKGHVLAFFHRLNGEVETVNRLLALSPGERKKMALAMGFFAEVSLVILDEPINHLDMVSRLAMEEALKSYTGGVLLVCHDRSFREAVTTTEWRIGGRGCCTNLELISNSVP